MVWFLIIFLLLIAPFGYGQSGLGCAASVIQSYHFVDEIVRVEEGKIHGRRFFFPDEPFRRQAADGSWAVSFGIIPEAIGQTLWYYTLARPHNRFTLKPIFVMADRIQIFQALRPGSMLNMHVKIEKDDLDAVNPGSNSFIRFSGCACSGGRVIQEMTGCTCQYRDLSSFEDPMQTRERYQRFVNNGDVGEASRGNAFPFSTLIDSVIDDVTDGCIVTQKTFQGIDWYYRDHFPRYPVTPAVILSEMIGETMLKLISPPAGKDLVPLEVRDFKMRAPVHPGDTVQVMITLMEPQLFVDRPWVSLDDAKKEIHARVVIRKTAPENTRVAQGLYIFELQ